MVTIDEVITGMTELILSGKTADVKSTVRDALHYLKEYRSEKAMWEADRKGYLNWIEQYKEAREKHQQAVIELKKNPPLTWDELRTMEGKPVWVEHHLFKGWRLIGWQGNDHMMNLVGPYSEQLPLFADGCGCDWQVYRKERK